MDERIAKLRSKAQQILERSIERPSLSEYPDDLKKLIEELNVYQVELELQNRELLDIHQQLLDAGQRYQELFDNAPVGFILVDKELQIKMINQTLATVLGHSTDHLIDQPLHQIIHPDDQDKFYLQYRAEFKKLQPVDCVFRINAPGFSNPVMLVKTIKPAHKEKYTRLSFTDITTQSEAEKKLSEKQQMLIEVEEMAKIGGFQVDFETKEMNWTHTFQRIHGIDDQLVPTIESFIKLYPGEYQDQLTTCFLSAARKQQDFELELPLILNNQEHKWVIIKAFCEGSTRKKIIGFVQDITMIKSFQEELITARTKAENSDHLKTAFLANISHEIRTPLNGILGFSELLSEWEEAPHEHKRYIQIIQESGERMLRLINDLIDISKIESKQIQLHYQEVSVHACLNDLVDFFTPEASNKNLTITLTTLPKEKIIITDEFRLKQILINLIKNAIKFTIKGGILVSCTSQKNQFSFSIEDSGIGIDREALPKIFDRFNRGTFLEAHKMEGAGLGLTITKALTEILGGSIQVISEAGKGSTFTVTLPQSALFR